MSYDYDRRKVAASERLDTKTRQQANQALRRVGLDGNGRFRKVGEALSAAFKALARFNIEPGDFLNAHNFSGASGSRQADLAFSNAQDSFSPTDISNSVLFIQWAELTPGRFEVTGYLS